MNNFSRDAKTAVAWNYFRRPHRKHLKPLNLYPTGTFARSVSDAIFQRCVAVAHPVRRKARERKCPARQLRRSTWNNALAAIPAPASGEAVTGIFGAHVVAVDADTGAVVAGAFGGWSCAATNPAVVQFDGSYAMERLPVGHNYTIYAEPLVGLAPPADFSDALNDLCAGSSPACATTPVNTNFNPRVQPAGP